MDQIGRGQQFYRISSQAPGSNNHKSFHAQISNYKSTNDQANQLLQQNSTSKSSSCYSPFKTTNSGFKSKQKLQSASSKKQESSLESQSKINSTANLSPQQVINAPKIIEVETLFIGGGPATLGVLSNAYQTQRIEDLICGNSIYPADKFQSNDHPLSTGQGNHSFSMSLNQMTDPMGGIKMPASMNHTFQGNPNNPSLKRTGIAIIDCSDQFGGGNLQKHYGIKSNTSASGFLKVIQYSKYNSANTGSKSISQPPSSVSNAIDRKFSYGGTIGQIIAGNNHAAPNVMQYANGNAMNKTGNITNKTGNLLNFAQKSQNRLRNQNSSLSISPQKQGKPVSKSISNAHQIMSNTMGPNLYKGVIGGQQQNQGGQQGNRIKAEADKQKEQSLMYMPPFLEFACTNDIAVSLQKYGKKVAPLQLIGTFLSYAGNAMLNDIWLKYQRKIFYGNSKAVKIMQISESVAGDTKSALWMTEVHFNKVPGNQKTFFRSKNIVMACGAEQLVPHNIRLKYGIKESALVLGSDQVLKQDGFQSLIQKIDSLQGRCKICILGGSHSAFSVLYLLLNGPCRIRVFDDYKRQCKAKSQVNKTMQKKNNSMAASPNTTSGKGSPTKNQSKSSKVKDLLSDVNRKSSSLVSHESTQRMHLGPRGYQMNFCYQCSYCHLGLTHSKIKSCSCGKQCLCLSNPQIPPSPRPQSSPSKSPDKKASTMPWPLLTGEDHVTIVYRKQIKVHFSTIQQAAQELYQSYDPKLDLSQGGIVYPFTGIRGDAKDLWMRVNKGVEPHASFVRADTLEEQRQQLSNADVVIFACGYQSKQVPIFDTKGQQIHLTSNMFLQQPTDPATLQRQLGHQTVPQTVPPAGGSQLCSGQTAAHSSMMQSLVVQKIQKPTVQTPAKGALGRQSTQFQKEYVDVNHNCQLMNARHGNQPIPGLYGIGQGYSLSTSDNSVQAELRPGGKADSVGLYIKQIGNKILSQLLPNKKIRYLMPPCDVQMGLAVQGQKTGSLLDQISNSKQQSISQAGSCTQHNPHGAINNQNGSQGAATNISGGSANPTYTQALDPAENSRTTTANLYHPKTQEHRSDKLHNFHYSGKTIGNTGPLNIPNQPGHFGSVFTKTVGSSHNVLSQMQKGGHSQNVSTILNGQQHQQAMAGHSINSMANRVNTANKSTSSQGFTSISELLGSRKIKHPATQVNSMNSHIDNYNGAQMVGGRLSLQKHIQSSLNSGHLSGGPSRSEERQLVKNNQIYDQQHQMNTTFNNSLENYGIKCNQVSAVTDISSLRTQVPQYNREPLIQAKHSDLTGGSLYQNRDKLTTDKSSSSVERRLKNNGSGKKSYQGKKKSAKQINQLKSNISTNLKEGHVGIISYSKPMENPSESLNQSNMQLNSESNKQFNLNVDIERHNLNQNKSLRLVYGSRTNTSNDHSQMQKFEPTQTSVLWSHQNQNQGNHADHLQNTQSFNQKNFQSHSPIIPIEANHLSESAKTEIGGGALVLINRMGADTVQKKTFTQNLFTDGGIVHHMPQALPNDCRSIMPLSKGQNLHGQSSMQVDQKFNESFASSKTAKQRTVLSHHGDVNPSIYRQNLVINSGANSSLDKGMHAQPHVSMSHSLVPPNEQQMMSKTATFIQKDDLHGSTSKGPLISQPERFVDELQSQPKERGGDSLIIQSDVHTNNFQIDSPKSYQLPARSYVQPQNTNMNKFDQMAEIPSFQKIQRHRNKEKLTQSVSGVASGRISEQRAGPTQSEISQAHRVELELPLSKKEMPLSDKGAPQSEITRNQQDHKRHFEAPMARNKGDAGSIVTSQRDVSRGKEPFLSPYVNMANRSSNHGSYVTPNRQTEFTTRLYASGGEATAAHGGDAELTSFMRLNQNNNVGSYFQSAFQDQATAGLSTGAALASSKPVAAPGVLQRQQQNLPTHPRSSGHKKKRGITGATGAAGSIMAANITNMGYHYPAVQSNDFAGTGGYADGNPVRMAEMAYQDKAGMTAKESSSGAVGGLSVYIQSLPDHHRQSPQSYSHQRHMQQTDLNDQIILPRKRLLKLRGA